MEEARQPKERPILFCAPMVRNILDGHKTQTRLVVKHKWPRLWEEPYYPTGNVLCDLPTQPGAWMEFRHRKQDHLSYQGSPASTLVACPYGAPGDRLWVRETWRIAGESPDDTLGMFSRDDVQYRADDDQSYIGTYRPSIHMPRWASRITLEITAVRVERLQEISYEDALAEGVADARPLLANGRPPEDGETPDETSRRLRWPQREYQIVWNTINGPCTWDKNPWVWVIEFKRVS